MRTTARLFFNAATKKPLPALKFTFDRATANRKLAEYTSVFEVGSPDKNEKALEISDHDPVEESFEPAFGAHVQGVTAEFIGEYEFHNWQVHHVLEPSTNGGMKLVAKRYLIIDEHACQGKLGKTDYPFGTTKLQFYAGFDYPRALIEPVIRTPIVADLKPLDEEMLNAFGTRKIVKPHEMSRAYALEKVIAGVTDMQRDRAKEQIISIAIAKHGRYPDGVRVRHINVSYKTADVFSFGVAVYAYRYKTGNLTRFKFINGNNSEIINGNKVLSVAKFTTAGAIFGGVATIVTALVNPYLLPLRLSIQIAVGASVSGTLSGAFARLFNQYDHYHFAQDTKREKEENARRPRTAYDNDNQRYADALNKEYEYTSPPKDSNRPRLPKEKLSLLGLDPNMDITQEMLHKAYITTLKQCHPDRNNMKEEDANAMTSAVNNAYGVLKKLIEQHEAEAGRGQEQSYRSRRP